MLDQNRHALFALSKPVYDPLVEITPQHGWMHDRLASVMLTVNIGQE